MNEKLLEGVYGIVLTPFCSDGKLILTFLKLDKEQSTHIIMRSIPRGQHTHLHVICSCLPQDKDIILKNLYYAKVS